VLGVGVGTLKEEFELLGAPFEDRGARADDAIRALRAIWGQSWAAYTGTHYDFADWWVTPRAPRTEVPILVGGRTRRSLRRAIELGDGWAPFALDLHQIRETLAWGRALDSWGSRGDSGFEVLVSSPRLDPAGDPAITRAFAEAAVAAGVTHWGADLTSRSAEHYVEQLEALQGLVASVTG
jgi:alkanesulfonate monooxygenase SsuD/methylene tetrahydromethanopterin reductase-like flavin-dependent oxidoreductase (luciferase family)